ncbi:MAG: lipopolysaccharide assembly protein LapA domain-containing protein [Acidimicrobiales bacterium]
MGVIIATVVLALLLVFILQNTKRVKISYFTAHGAMPLGVALLLAAIGGVLFAAVVGSLRIWQLRHRLSDAKHPDGRSSWRSRYRRRPKAA